LCFLALIEIAEDRMDEAKACINQALDILRDVGMTFFGPIALGIAARLADEPTEWVAFLEEAEQVLKAGCVSHNYFLFYRDGIETALEHRDWPRAERYCDALENYTSGEPLPWSDLFIRRGRALARHGLGDRSPQLATELEQVAVAVKEAGFVGHLSAIAEARTAM
jgi:hypothetical protein